MCVRRAGRPAGVVRPSAGTASRRASGRSSTSSSSGSRTGRSPSGCSSPPHGRDPRRARAAEARARQPGRAGRRGGPPQRHRGGDPNSSDSTRRRPSQPSKATSRPHGADPACRWVEHIEPDRDQHKAIVPARLAARIGHVTDRGRDREISVSLTDADAASSDHPRGHAAIGRSYRTSSSPNRERPRSSPIGGWCPP